MSISVVCQCGKRLEAREEHAGKRAKCPNCGQVLLIPGQPLPTYDVFLSYSKDDKPTAEAICAALEANGIRCWIAPRDITPGKEWGEAIIDGINQCRAMVLVFSSKSNQSPQVRREIERAVAKGLVIIPFRTEDIPMSKTMEYFLSSAHWLDAMTPPLEKHLIRLAASVKTLLSQSSTTACESSEHAAEKPRSGVGAATSRPWRPWTWASRHPAPAGPRCGTALKGLLKIRKRRMVLGMIIAIGGLAILLGIVARLRRDGLVIVDLSEPNGITLQILSEEGKPQSDVPGARRNYIAVAPGKHLLRLKVDEKFFECEFTIESGSTKFFKDIIEVPGDPGAFVQDVAHEGRQRAEPRASHNATLCVGHIRSRSGSMASIETWRGEKTAVTIIADLPRTQPLDIDYSIDFDITNMGSSDLRIVSMKVKVIDFAPIETMTGYMAAEGIGKVRKYFCLIDKDKSLYQACYPVNDEYLILKPHELETVGLMVNTRTEGKYTVNLEIEYSSEGRTGLVAIGPFEDVWFLDRKTLDKYWDLCRPKSLVP